jgi:transposase
MKRLKTLTKKERKAAKEYGVARSTINSIKRRVNWK